MVDKRYGIPFVAALVLNLAYWGVVGDWFGHIKPPETPKKDLVINLDMVQPEPPEQEKKQQEKMVSDDKKMLRAVSRVVYYRIYRENRHRACKILTLI